MGQDFKEKAVSNIDPKKYKDNHAAIFGERISIECKYCGLSSRQKNYKQFTCPHCRKEGVVNE